MPLAVGNHHFGLFTSFSVSNGKKEGQEKEGKIHKRGLPGFRCIFQSLADTQKLVDSWKNIFVQISQQFMYVLCK